MTGIRLTIGLYIIYIIIVIHIIATSFNEKYIATKRNAHFTPLLPVPDIKYQISNIKLFRHISFSFCVLLVEHESNGPYFFYLFKSILISIHEYVYTQ